VRRVEVILERRKREWTRSRGGSWERVWGFIRGKNCWKCERNSRRLERVVLTESITASGTPPQLSLSLPFTIFVLNVSNFNTVTAVEAEKPKI
jgi:hypothetical protein